MKLGPHVIGEPASLPEFVAQSQPTVIKYLNPDKPNMLQAPITIGRIHWLSEEKNMSDPLGLAQHHADTLIAQANLTGITLWEGINEPPVWNGDDYIQRLCVYEKRRTEILNARGLYSVVLNLSVGWPGEENGQIVWEPFRGLLEDLPHGNYLGLHEYWYPMGPLQGDSLTHRTGRLFRCPFDVDILITECGCDVGGGQGDGWRAQGLSVAQYSEQLAQYRDLIATDKRVKGATVFTYGNTGDWSAFDIEPDWAEFVPVFAEGGQVPEITIDKYPLPKNKSCIGLHWTPVPSHAVADLRPFMDRAMQANVGWITLIDDGGGSVLQPSVFYGGRSVVDELQEREFNIIVRLFSAPWAKVNSRMIDTCGRLVEHGVHYVFACNEPECEWDSSREGVPDRPDNWVEVVFRNWVEGAYKMKSVGAYPGTPALTTFRMPDANGNIVNPFKAYITEQERSDLFINWYAWVNRHIYLIHHPIDYPYDDVNQYGKYLTHKEYLDAINEVSLAYRDRTGEPWVWETWEDSEHHINLQRDEGKQPGSTIWDDDVCWLSYRGTVGQMEEAGIANHAIMLCTEGLLNIGDKGKDGRYPRVTAAAQVITASQVYEQMRNDRHLKTVCAWLAGVREMDAVTADGFERQGWWTHEWDEVFELNGEIPLVQHLIDNPSIGIHGNAPTPNPDPEPPPDPDPIPEPGLNNDAESYGVTVVPAAVEPGEKYYKIVRVYHYGVGENGGYPGRHNLYMDVLDEKRQRLNGTVLTVANTGNQTSTSATVDKPPNEPGTNVPIEKNDTLSAWVRLGKSDIVNGIHTRHDDEGEDVRWGHHSFLVEWQLCTKTGEIEPEPPPPEPTEPLGEFIRRMAWDRLYPDGVNRNPDAAFQRVAFERVLGAPRTNEFRVTYGGTVYAAQGFDCILWTEEGNWNDIRELEWNAL